ncbi:hypothetical protein F511_37022 [Dorcoceras hygrometricum]|uniref:Uncharacterized protein n=1 Tax=Dorcoceras hygrometricum TaxID=472368 RepID=A0A2Z7ARU3_9LAMI|nr:hypothetical protein F511_37022 [Dorcoceras hygrometricum]
MTHRIMVKRLATSPHDPLGITDSACKNQSVMVSVQYGPFNTYIPIRSTIIGKSRVARDPITMHTSWRSNSGIACVTSIGYPRTKESGESSTTKHRLLHASGPHPIPPPDDPNKVGKRVKVKHLSRRVSMTFRVMRANLYNQDLGLIHSTNGNHLECPNEGSSIDHQASKLIPAWDIQDSSKMTPPINIRASTKLTPDQDIQSSTRSSISTASRDQLSATVLSDQLTQRNSGGSDLVSQPDYEPVDCAEAGLTDQKLVSDQKLIFDQKLICDQKLIFDQPKAEMTSSS